MSQEELKNKQCGYCRNPLSECKCTLEQIKGNQGSYSPARFGVDGMELSFVMIEHQMVLKLKLFNDYIYLNHEGIAHLHDFTGDFLNVKESIYQKRLVNWNCDYCDKPTNNMQEICDKCQEEHEGCDC